MACAVVNRRVVRPRFAISHGKPPPTRAAGEARPDRRLRLLTLLAWDSAAHVLQLRHGSQGLQGVRHQLGPLTSAGSWLTTLGVLQSVIPRRLRHIDLIGGSSLARETRCTALTSSRLHLGASRSDSDSSCPDDSGSGASGYCMYSWDGNGRYPSSGWSSGWFQLATRSIR